MPGAHLGVSATAEAAGGAALLVDPADLGQIEEAMERLVYDASLRESLISKGLARAEDFTWDKSAAVLRSALERLKGTS